ncbi:Alpha/beta hydrolase OS=Streptomyces fumanus OX=67302 GN=GCM10018772_42420 PE=4 SV=1 [Streptomyces fumanus]
MGGVVLLLPGGDEVSERRPSPLLATASVLALGRKLARAGRDEGLAAHVVHYRYRGWNGGAAHPARDAGWAADEVRRPGVRRRRARSAAPVPRPGLPGALRAAGRRAEAASLATRR